MFDIGWTELVVVAIVAILVVGPKDLPGMLRGFGKTMGSLRRMARDFQRQFDEALKEAELDEVKKAASKPFQPLEDARKAMQSYQDEVSGAIKDSPATDPAKKDEAAESAGKTAKTKPQSGRAAATNQGSPKRASARAKPATKAAKGIKAAPKAGSGGARKAATKPARGRKTAKSGAGATGRNS